MTGESPPFESQESLKSQDRGSHIVFNEATDQARGHSKVEEVAKPIDMTVLF